jgi:hypothetical protein
MVHLRDNFDTDEEFYGFVQWYSRIRVNYPVPSIIRDKVRLRWIVMKAANCIINNIPNENK